MTTSVLVFSSEESSQADIRDRYVLAELSRYIVEGSRVTLTWRDSSVSEIHTFSGVQPVVVSDSHGQKVSAVSGAGSDISADALEGSGRLEYLLTQLERKLVERYAFDVFAEDTINFGIMADLPTDLGAAAISGRGAREHDSACPEGNPPLYDALSDEEEARG